MSSEIANAQAQQPVQAKSNVNSEALHIEVKEEAKGSRWFLPFVLFLLVPSLYAIGITYWEAWLRAHGFTAVVFPLSFDQAVFKGYEAIVLLLMSWLLPYLPRVPAMMVALLILWIVAAALIVLWGVVGAFLVSLISLALQKFRAFVIAHAPAVRILGKAYLIASAPFLAAGAVLYFFLLLIVPIIIGQHAGKKIGQKSLEEIQSRIKVGKFKAGDQFATLTEGNEEPLLVISCGPYGCGIAKKESTMFVTWDRIAKVETHTGE